MNVRRLRHVKRTISSSVQSAFKILVLFVGVLMAAGFLAGYTFTGPVPWSELLLFGGVWFFFFWFAVSRKTIQLDDHFLYISVFRRVVPIPLGDISSVTETVGMKDRSVTIYFRRDTPFGRSVTFTPTLVFGSARHPIVTELLTAAKNEREPVA